MRKTLSKCKTAFVVIKIISIVEIKWLSFSRYYRFYYYHAALSPLSFLIVHISTIVVAAVSRLAKQLLPEWCIRVDPNPVAGLGLWGLVICNTKLSIDFSVTTSGVGFYFLYQVSHCIGLCCIIKCVSSQHNASTSVD